MRKSGAPNCRPSSRTLPQPHRAANSSSWWRVQISGCELRTSLKNLDPYDAMDGNPLPQLYSTVVRVQDLERSQHWYETVLGFQITFRDPSYKLMVLCQPGSAAMMTI